MLKYMKKHHQLIIGMIFLILGCLLPLMLDIFWFNMIVDIRKAIVLGDSGHLILTSSIYGYVVTGQNTLILIGIGMMMNDLNRGKKPVKWSYLWVQLCLFGLTMYMIDHFTFLSLEMNTSMVAAAVTLVLIRFFSIGIYGIGRGMVLSLQVFLAFHWLNMMPILSPYNIGNKDISLSIKLASEYLGSYFLLNFMGVAFFITMMFSTLMTSIFFGIYERNSLLTRESYEKEKVLNSIRSKVVQNRVYEEMYTITHDLKTPLVTISGLNSLIAITKDKNKIVEYTECIDNAAGKMSEMISGFLYESSKQSVSSEAVIDYVRAQIPVEDEDMKVVYRIEKNLPHLYINKIRVARALVNILENAMIVPTKMSRKEIKVNAFKVKDDLVIEISDNGIGIQPNQMEKIWEIGYTTNETTGLGLAFAKKSIEDNGGTISIYSMPNVGTKVKITLPDEAFEEREEE